MPNFFSWLCFSWQPQQPSSSPGTTTRCALPGKLPCAELYSFPAPMYTGDPSIPLDCRSFTADPVYASNLQIPSRSQTQTGWRSPLAIDEAYLKSVELEDGSSTPQDTYHQPNLMTAGAGGQSMDYPVPPTWTPVLEGQGSGSGTASPSHRDKSFLDLRTPREERFDRWLNRLIFWKLPISG